MERTVRNPIKITDHGKAQLEVKTHYSLTGAKKDRYSVDLWFFVPSPLRMNTEEYGIENFLADTHCQIRMSPAFMPISRIIDPKCKISPLTRIRSELERAALPQDIRNKRILYEMRTLANIFGTETSGSEHIIAEAVNEGRMNVVKNAIKANLKDIKSFLESWRSLYELFLEPAVDSQLRDAYAWTDESVSLATERVLTRLYRSIVADEEAPSLTKRILRLAEAEKEHRLLMGYTTLNGGFTKLEAEQRLYHESILKKWGQSALYLTLEESGTSRRIGQIIAAAAAAAAMAFAVVATLLAEHFFPGKGIAWALVVVIAYIFKDRIKESLRALLLHTLPSLISDSRIRLVDQASGRRVGRVSNRVRFMKARKSPLEIHRLRYSGENPLRQILPEEDLIHFRRNILIRNKRLKGSHTRLTDLSDIIRIKLDRALREMDDPEKTFPVFANGGVQDVIGKRVYHINLIVGLSLYGEGIIERLHCRLIISRNGLERIEELES